jgi:hypothetical protein
MLTAVDFYPPEKIRFLFYPPGNVHFKMSVKYNFKTAINHKGRKAGRATGATVLGITMQKQDLSALKASVRRFLLISLLEAQRRNSQEHQRKTNFVEAV